MQLSNIKVEQINNNYEVVEDYGEILSKSEMKTILLNCFTDTKYEKGCIWGELYSKKYCIFIVCIL